MAQTETQLSEFKLNYLTEEQYNTAKDAGELNENEIYMTPDEEEKTVYDYAKEAGYPGTEDEFKEKLLKEYGENVEIIILESKHNSATYREEILINMEPNKVYLCNYSGASSLYINYSCLPPANNKIANIYTLIFPCITATEVIHPATVPSAIDGTMIELEGVTDVIPSENNMCEISILHNILRFSQVSVV